MSDPVGSFEVKMEDVGGPSIRKDWIDVVRGVGILLVIVGHMSISEALRQFIYCFHMPLFFLVSGFLYRNNLSWGWVLRRLDGLLVPYLLWGLLEVLTCVFAKGEAAEPLVTNFLLGNGAGVSWFLMCLLLVDLMGAGIEKVFCRWLSLWYCRLAVITALAFGGYLVLLSPLPNVCMCRSVLPALSFWMTGRALAQASFMVQNPPPVRTCLLHVTPLFVIGLLLSRVQSVNLAGGEMGDPLVFYVTAFVLSYCVFLLCRGCLARSRALRYLGVNSLLFMGWHIIVPPVLKCLFALAGVDIDSGILIKVASRVLNVGVLVGLVWLSSRWGTALAGRWQLFHVALQSAPVPSR